MMRAHLRLFHGVYAEPRLTLEELYEAHDAGPWPDEIPHTHDDPAPVDQDHGFW